MRIRDRPIDELHLQDQPAVKVQAADARQRLPGLFARTCDSVRARWTPFRSSKVVQYFSVGPGISSGSRVIISSIGPEMRAV